MIPELSRDNPRLKDLEAVYRNLGLFDHSLWRTFADGIDIQNFRGEHAYLSTWYGGMTEERYQNTYEYLVEIGEFETIKRLGEDGAFGCVTFSHDWGANEDDIVFSRDLLDSVCELQFLREELGLRAHDPVTFLDIGAGYGRFAHRAAAMFPHSRILCADAVPLSTFLCQFYIDYRRIQGNAFAAPLHEREVLDLPFTEIDIACNMYSFSEMPLSAVRFWLSFCADLNIKYFFLVPHAGDLVHPHFITSEPDGSHLNYWHEFERHGYRLKVRQPKFPLERVHELIYSTDYLLFERG